MRIELLLKDEEFADIMMAHCADIIDFMISVQSPFGIVCDVNEVEFEPALPKEIADSLKQMTMFELGGYTLESAQIDEEGEFLMFSAAFGEQNFESSVSVATNAIVQVVVSSTPIFVNLSALPQNRSKKTFRASITGNELVDRSMQSFLDNPENKKFFE